MKKLLGLLIFVFSLSAYSQEESRFKKSFTEADYAFTKKEVIAKAVRKAAKETNAKFAEELAEITSVSPEILNRITPQNNAGTHIITNDPNLPVFLKEFYDGAKYAKVDYSPELENLKKVILVQADLNFLGGVVEIDGGKEIWLNSHLLQYPNLYRVIFYRQMGMLYGLKEAKDASPMNIMTDRWEISPKYEYYAYNLRQRHTQEKNFFDQMVKKHPLDKKL